MPRRFKRSPRQVAVAGYSGIETPFAALERGPTELVIGLVSAVGTDQDGFATIVDSVLREYGYTPNFVRMSDLLLKELNNGSARIPSEPEDERISALMTAGTRARKDAKRGDLLALYAMARIHRVRKRNGGRRAAGLERTAHVLRTLKHPDEVKSLRRVYGPGFFLIGIYGTEAERLAYLENERNIPKDRAQLLIERDQDEGEPLGQQTRKTFALADAFIRLKPNRDEVKRDLQRVLDLVFGSPYVTPTEDEYAMFLAFAAALRSGDLSRQVGAVVRSSRGDVVASGANDVPRNGGGLYWPGEKDQRDHVKGFDSNERWRNSAVVEVVRRLAPGRKGESEARLLKRGRKLLAESPVLDITEFGRAVHAEMEALLSCARSGISPVGGTLYTTTFPCHNCAKHIVASGVARVVFVEPYAKSKARQLHADALSVETPQENHVLFEPFIGLGPRRFFDLFSMELGTGYLLERKKSGKVVSWARADANPRVPLHVRSYLGREELAVAEIGLRTR